MTPRPLLVWLLALNLFAWARSEAAPLRVFLRASSEIYGPGIHDHPRFLADWTTLLGARGAEVRGGLEFPSAGDLAKTDVLVLYAHEGATIHGDERTRLEAYLARGGGIVVVHDALAGDDPQWWKTVVGGAWEHRHSKEHTGIVGLYVRDRAHAITAGAQNFDLDDEIYLDLHMMPEAQVLMSGFHSVFAITPQMWVYEKDRYRAFVTLQGHRTATFAHAAWRTMLLRGIAWAGRREVDLLTDRVEAASMAYPEGGPKSPEAALGTLEAQPDFELRLVAAEPLVVNPISIDWDARGRMWVALTPGYPDKASSSGIPAHDRIVILSDRDGDGRMDESKVFADGLDLVTSFVFHQDGVIVSAAPDLLWLRDRDGDDVADQKVVLYSGFGFADTHATISNLRWGLDGFVYAVQGYSGQGSLHVVGARDFGPIPGGILRFRPDRSAMENVLTASSNVWGLDFDWDGEAFYSLANGAHARHVVTWDRTLASGRIDQIEGFADIADHGEVVPIRVEDREPYRQIDFVGGFTAAAGDVIYDGGAWPEEYRGNHFVCEPTVNLVHRDVVRAEGVSFRATKARRSEFLASTDLWFRPVQLRVGPDGALYVLDFYNQAVVHDDARGPEKGPTNAAVRPDRDDLHGRVWRVQHKRARAGKSASLVSAGEAAWVEALAEGSSPRRATAMRLLRDRGASAAAGVATALTSASPAARVAALWLLHEAHELPDDALRKALSDADPGVRKNAWRIAGLVGARMADAALSAIAKEKNPRVRIEAIAAMGQPLTTTEPGVLALLALAPELDDAWSRSALLHAFAERPSRLLAAAFAKHATAPWLGWVEAASELVGRGRDASELERMMVAASAPEAEPRLVVVALERLVEYWPAEEIATPAPRLEPSLARLLQATSVVVVRASLPVASRVGTAAITRRVSQEVAEELAVLQSSALPSERRLAALGVLLAIPEQRAPAIKLAALLLVPGESRTTQEKVIGVLGSSSEPSVAETLSGAFHTLAPTTREAAFLVLSRRPAWTLRFLAALKSGEVQDADLGIDRRSRLLDHPDPAVRRRAREVLSGSDDSGSGDVDALIAELHAVVEQPGSAENGKRIFEQNCATCHRVLGEGAGFGPDLTGMGVGGPSSLLSSVLDPNRVVDPSYQLYAARTADGRTLTGILARDTPDRIVLREPSGETTLRRSEIQTLEPTGRSPMPTGFEALGGPALRDLFTYLGAGYDDFRILDLEALCTASTWYGLYDVKRNPTHMDFVRYGAIGVGGVPFEVLDPVRTASGYNAIVLKGGEVFDSDAKLRMPQRVEIAVGYPLRRVHVLGGIAGWGYPFRDHHEPAVRWTWRYADGTSEEIVLEDGREFADWIKKIEVPGSRHVPGLLREASPGQVRRFSVAPSRHDVAVRSVVLESYDNHLAPTFLALTAQPASTALTPALVASLDAIRAGLADAAARPTALASAEALLASAVASDLQTAIVDELGSWADADVAEILTGAYAKLEPLARERGFQSLTDDFEGTTRLLNAVAVGRIPASALLPSEELRLRLHSEPTLAARASAVFAAPNERGWAELEAEGGDGGTLGLDAFLSIFARGYGGYRAVDLTQAATASTSGGLYDPERSRERLRFRRRGVRRAAGVPYWIADPARSPSGFDAIVLKGGMEADWDSKRKRPQKVEIALGYPLRRVHVLGGIAAWGYPFTEKREPLVRWTFVYHDGVREEHILRDGHEFAEFLRRVEVPGSKYVRGFLEKASVGQLRRFSVAAKRPDAIVDSLVLESFDTYAAPTFLALTAEVGEPEGIPLLPWLGLVSLIAIGSVGVRHRRARVRRRVGERHSDR